MIFPFAWVVMQLGKVVVVPGAALIAIMGRRFRLAVALAAAGSLVWIVAKIVKEIVPRGRPGELLDNLCSVMRSRPAMDRYRVTLRSFSLWWRLRFRI